MWGVRSHSWIYVFLDLPWVDGPFLRVHTNLLEERESLPRTVEGHKYASTITDYATRYRWVKFLKNKDQTLTHLKNFMIYVQIHFNITSCIIRSDNDGEYDSDKARDWMKSVGILQKLTISDSPEQNGIDERTNEILLTRPRAQLIATRLPATLWGETFRTTIYIINRSPTSVLNKTPHEALHKIKSNLSRIHPFELTCYAHDYKCKIKGKMASRGFKYFFLGYERTNQYRLWDNKMIKLIRRRDMIWDLFGTPTTTQDGINQSDNDSSDQDARTIIIQIESSHGRIQEISESEAETDPQNLPADATDEQFATGDPNLRQKRLRNSTRNQKKNLNNSTEEGLLRWPVQSHLWMNLMNQTPG